jgi:hypothetical protein
VSLSNASCPPVRSTLVAPLPLVAPLCCAPLVVHSGWLLCRLSSHRRLSSTCASTSHRTTASHCAPLAPLVRLVVVWPLVTPPSPVRLRLRLPSHHHLLSRPSYSSCPAGCHVTSCHAAASCQTMSPPLIAPLVRLVVASPIVTPPHPPHCTPLAPLIRLIVVSPLITPPPPVHLRLRLSAHLRLIPHPSHDKRCVSLTPLIRLVVALPLVTLPPSVRLRLRLSLHLCLSSFPLAPLVWLVAVSPLVMLPLPFTCASASHRTTASHHTPFTPLVRLVVASLSPILYTMQGRQ